MVIQRLSDFCGEGRFSSATNPLISPQAAAEFAANTQMFRGLNKEHFSGDSRRDAVRDTESFEKTTNNS